MTKRLKLAVIAVLFDLEGTLVKSMENDKNSILEFRAKTRQKLVELGIPPRELIKTKTSTLMRNKAREYVDENFNRKGARSFHFKMDKFLKSFELYWAYRTEIFEDTIPALQKLRVLKCKMGVVTNTSREAAELILSLNGLGSFFEVTVTREDVNRLKPDPEGIRHALEILHVKDFFFVGDLVLDSLAAEGASGVSIIVNRDPSKKLKFNADYIVNSLLEIPRIVASVTS